MEPEIDEGLEMEQTESSPEQRGDDWIGRQKDKLKEFAVNFFHAGDDSQFANTLAKADGVLLAGLGTTLEVAPKLIGASGPTMEFGAILTLMGLTGIAAGTWSTEVSRRWRKDAK